MSSTRRKGDLTLTASIALVIKTVKTGLFGVLVISARNQSSARWVPVVSLFVRLWQMLSFVTNRRTGSPWSWAIVPLEGLSSFTNLRGYTGLAPGGAASITDFTFYASVGWVSTLIFLLAWGIFCFARNSFPFMWPLKVLSIMGNMSASIFFIPLLQMLLSPLSCANCVGECASCSDTGASTAKTIAGCVLAAVLAALAMLFAAVFFDWQPLSRNPSARAHGRADIVMLAVQIAAVIVGGSVLPNLNVWVVVIVLILCGVAWITTYTYYMPYYAHWMNVGQIAFSCIYFWRVVYPR
jgi:hypothetical protein